MRRIDQKGNVSGLNFQFGLQNLEGLSLETFEAELNLVDFSLKIFSGSFVGEHS
jgi:hypothetical protein